MYKRRRGVRHQAVADARCGCQTPGVIETDAIVLRAIRYGEADSVLTLYTRERGRLSAIAQGTRKATSKLGGRLQPSVLVHLGLHQGRGDLCTVRHAQVIDAHAGLWVEGYRLRASSSILEAAARILMEEEPNEGAFNVLCRGLAHLSRAEPSDRPPRHDPIVLGVHAKLLVVAGILPRLAACTGCGSDGPFTAFSARTGGALCAECAHLGEPVRPEVFQGLVELVGRPLADSEIHPFPAGVADGIERMIGAVLQEHLGVRLRSGVAL